MLCLDRRSMKVVYVAGPFRGPSHWSIHQNIYRAETLALAVWAMGAAAICPHLNTAHFQNELPDHVWLDGDIELLRRCDAIIMTDDWRKSVGAVTEHEFAIANNIPVFYDVAALSAWMEEGDE
jgi:hypothetical protein